MENMQEWLTKQRHKEKLCTRTLKGKALLCIDHILSNIESEDPLLGKLYRIAHCAIGVCENPHEDWIKEVNETYESFVA